MNIGIIIIHTTAGSPAFFTVSAGEAGSSRRGLLRMTTAIHNTNTIAKLDTMISGHMDVLLWGSPIRAAKPPAGDA
jgi:hypothetical protein